MKKDTWMMFYVEARLQYLENDASWIGLGAGLLKVRDCINCALDERPDNMLLQPTAFPSMSLYCTERRCSNLEREVLGILHRQEKFQHYCFSKEVSIIMDHKPQILLQQTWQNTTVVTIILLKNTSMQNTYTLHTSPTPIHNRLVPKAKSCTEQRLR